MDGRSSEASAEVTATPFLPVGIPQNVVATAGNQQVQLRWDTVAGATYYNVYTSTVSGSYGDATVTTSTYNSHLINPLTNGTTYYFEVKAGNDGELSGPSAEVSARPYASSSSSGGGTPSPSSGDGTPSPSTGADILVNGRKESGGTATTTTINNRTITTITLDQEMLAGKLAEISSGAVFSIPVNNGSDVVVGVLNGQMVKSMEGKEAFIEIRTDNAGYMLPANQIDIDAVAKQIGDSVSLLDIEVHIEISKPTENVVQIVNDASTAGAYRIVAPPLSFTVTAKYGDQTIDISTFNAYVERTVAIPDGVDPSQITTGVVIEPDGSVRHVPTKITVEDGKYYAKIKSLTNSTYTVVWNPIVFSDVVNHWAKDAVNDMGSRMVISGFDRDHFKPNRDITRADFAAIIAKGLGLRLEKGTNSLSDVNPNMWYHDYVQTVQAYGLINGFEDGSFRPNDRITREQAMVILAKAMQITGLQGATADQSANILQLFTDADQASSWAKSGIADSVIAGIVTGRSNGMLEPKAYVTRAEVAMMIQRLLKLSDLI